MLNLPGEPKLSVGFLFNTSKLFSLSVISSRLISGNSILGWEDRGAPPPLPIKGGGLRSLPVNLPSGCIAPIGCVGNIGAGKIGARGAPGEIGCMGKGCIGKGCGVVCIGGG